MHESGVAKPKRRRRWRRRIAWTLLAIATVVVAIPFLLLASLRVASVRDALVSRISATLERDSRTTVRVRGLDVDPLGGVIVVHGLELARTGHRDQPFLIADTVHCVLDLRALAGRRLEIRRLSVDRPKLLRDGLEASTTQDEDSAPPRIPAALVIRAFSIHDGEVPVRVSGAPENSPLGVWHLTGIDIDGSIAGGRVQAVISRGGVHMTPLERPVDFAIAGALSIEPDFSFRISDARASGSGLALDANGAGTLLDPGFRMRADYRVKGELGEVLSEFFPRGSVMVSGRLDFGEYGVSGTALVEAREVALDTLGELNAIELPPALALMGSHADIRGELAFDLTGVSSLSSLPADAIHGELTAGWRRGEARVLDVSIRSEPEASASPDRAALLTVDATLLPDARGSRRLAGKARIASWGELARVEVLDANIVASEPELRLALERFGLAVSWPETLPDGGSIDARVDAAGPLDSIQLHGEATWRDGTETLATVSARSVAETAIWPLGEIAADIEASLLPQSPGTRTARARLIGAHLHDGTARIDLPDLGPAVVDILRRAKVVLPERSPSLDTMLSGPFQADVKFSGRVTEPQLALDASWQPGGKGAMTLRASGRPIAGVPYFDLDEDAQLEAHDIDAGRFGADGVIVHALDATSDGNRVKVRSIAATLPAVAPSTVGGEASGHGEFDLAWPPPRAALELTIDHPVEGVDRVSASLRIEDGIAHLEDLDVASGATHALAEATIPLSVLAGHAGTLDATLASYPSGPIEVRAEGLDLAVLRRLLPLPADFPQAVGVVELNLAVDPKNPAAGSGQFVAREVAFDFDGARLAADGPVQLTLAGGKAVLAMTKITTAGAGEVGVLPGELSGTVQLAQDWSPGMQASALIHDFNLDFHGTVAAAALTRLLKEGTASGGLKIDATAHGPMDAVVAKVDIAGPDARISFRSPYATRFEAPEAHLHYRDGALVIDSARAQWNTGDLSLHGKLDPKGNTDVTAEFSAIAYRLDYGLNARLGGRLQLLWPVEGDRRLLGTVVIDRATLRRNVALDREVLRTLFEPVAAGDSPLLDSIEADIEITTTKGLQIKNNVADLHADWDALHVTGTLAAPRISGQARVTPGGLLNVFGNIARIDEATFSWSGDPPSAPRVAMKTTSAVDEPSIKNQWYSSWYQAPIQGPGQGGTMDLTSQRASSAEVMDAFASGMMSYYQDRLAGVFGGGATQAELSYEPLTLFGETDTTARMTITQRLSRYAKFVASYSPTDAEAQTFILEVGGLDIAPSLTAQVFTNDEKHAGGTLQQTVRLGKGYEDEITDRLRKIKIEVPKGISKRKLRKAISYRPGDALAEEATMDVEFDVLEAMARIGYPQAEATVETRAHKPRRIDLAIRVVPGPLVRCEFEGDQPRKSARRAIAALYRFDDEEASLAEMRERTVLALQSRGYLDPHVEVAAERSDTDVTAAPVTIRVRAEGGRKIDPHAPSFVGVPQEESTRLAALFATRETRTALAAGTPATEARIKRTLAAAGFPEARVVSRELSENGKELVVHIEPGGRLRLASIELAGLSPADEQRLEPLLGLREGDPVRADRIAAAVVVVEQDLMTKGHARADIRTRLAPVSADRPLDRALVLEAIPGPTFEIASVELHGAQVSKPKWLEKTADLDPGTPADPGQVAKARTRLAQTGVFEEIKVSTDPPITRSAKSSEIAATERAVPTAVKFDLAERKRWQLGYGGRYESEVGFGVMINLDNLNSLGRGHTSGVRGIYGEEHQEIQLYHVIPRIFGERSSLEGFLQWKKELTEGVWSEGEQAWAQVSLPLSARWQTRTYAVVENRTLTSEDPNAPLDQRAISPRLGWQLVYDSRVIPTAGLGPPRGFFYGLNLIGALESLGSDVSSLGTYQQWSYFLPLGNRERARTHWAQSYRISTVNVKDDTVPFDNLLRAGGEFSVRGYPTNSLGPLDDVGNATGGELLALANQELHFILWKTLSGLAFVDLGNVWATIGDYDGHFSSSYGLGLRWASPVGPLRLDWAVPINPRPGDPGHTYYFGFGNVF